VDVTIINQYQFGKKGERSDSVLLQDTSPVLAWKDQGKSQKISVTILGTSAYIRMDNLEGLPPETTGWVIIGV
jgi:hypothetical protein